MLSGRPSFVLFDLDGTVWDSIPGIVGTLAHTLAELDLPVPGDDVLAANVGPPLLEMLGHYGVADERLDEGRRIYRARYAEWGEFECTVYDGVPELLDELRSSGARLATATSKGVDPTRRMLDHFGLATHFEVIAAEPMDGSGANGTPSGKSGVIADALERLSRPDPDQGVMVGDRHYDINAGRRAGLATVGVRWGYGSEAEFDGCRPDHRADDLPHLTQLLSGH